MIVNTDCGIVDTTVSEGVCSPEEGGTNGDLDGCVKNLGMYMKPRGEGVLLNIEVDVVRL